MEEWLLVAAAVAFCIFILAALFGVKGRWASYLSFAGCIAIMAALLLRWFSTGRAPWATLYETAALLAFVVTMASAYLYRKKDEPFLYMALAAIGVLLLAFSALSWEESPVLSGALNSGWLVIHVPVVILAYGLFAVSFAASSALLLLKIKKQADERTLARLDSIAYVAIAGGFVLLAAGIVMGAVWAKGAWGAYWSWDPKETWALITLMFYGIYLASRIAGVKGEDAAFVSMLGFLAVLFTYLGVSYLIPGLHSYA